MAKEKKRIITMVGTSLIENYKDYNKSAYERFDSICKDNQRTYEELKSDSGFMDIKIKLAKYLKENDRAAAEQVSCFKIIKRLKDSNISKNQIQIYLLCSDTLKSEILAHILEDYFNSIGINTFFKNDKYKINGLQVNNSELFEKKGVHNLFDILQELHGDYGQQNSLIINATGGYKGAIPYLTIYGQIYKIPVYYHFKDTKEIIELPQYDLELDYNRIEENLMAFKEIRNCQIQNKPKTKKFIIEYLSGNRKEAKKEYNILKKNNLIKELNYKDEKVVSLTAVGSMYYDSYQNRYEKSEDNLAGELVELKLYKYFNSVDNLEVQHGVKYKDSNQTEGEIDLLVKNKIKKEINIVEVKPGGNIDFKKIQDQLIRNVEYCKNNLLSKEEKENTIKFQVYLYRGIQLYPKGKSKNILDGLKDLDELAKKYCDKIEWYWIKYSPRKAGENITQNKIELYHSKEEN
ncbi:MAG: hypothetical protein ACOCRX_10240 [Candidatus Woesearchaeota archaeon]